MGTSRRSCQRVRHDLRLKPCGVSVVQELRLRYEERRVANCEWLLNIVVGRFVDPILFFSTDEA